MKALVSNELKLFIYILIFKYMQSNKAYIMHSKSHQLKKIVLPYYS